MCLLQKSIYSAMLEVSPRHLIILDNFNSILHDLPASSLSYLQSNVSA